MKNFPYKPHKAHPADENLSMQKMIVALIITALLTFFLLPLSLLAQKIPEYNKSQEQNAEFEDQKNSESIIAQKAIVITILFTAY